MPTTLKPVNIHLSEPMRDWLTQQAERESQATGSPVSVAALVRRAVHEMMQREEATR